MPAGKPNSKPIIPNLESFLMRKKISLQQWLSSNAITTQDDLEAFLGQSSWAMEESIIMEMRAITGHAKPVGQDALTPSEATPPEATPPEATPPEATPPEATPPEATPPEATPPEATPPEATPPEATPPEATPPEATILHMDSIQSQVSNEEEKTSTLAEALEATEMSSIIETIRQEENTVADSGEINTFTAIPNIILNKERKKNRY